ncbi:hypothetical protein KO493_15695 [Tamlana agarivorans]|uniref:Uncharacterized protein n=1 Tax=Pseudotamlana agarivorans TaxID=481183 RepID=A0ACC5UCY7_9FLAO|nr:hypothetical protein [Tamlana agarivorans]MBU2952144.1 hypothetical protein [Tamlana agarivorans]
MRKFFKNIILFSILLFVAEKGVYYFLNQAPKNEYDKRLENIVNNDMDYELIILGSSRGANNVVACQLENQTGLKSYNLSYKGSNVIFHDFILETYLKFNKNPQIILLFLDHKFTFVEESTLTFRYDRLFPLSKYDYINDVLIEKKKKNVLSKFFALSRVNRADFNMKKRSSRLNNTITRCGSILNLKPNHKELVYNSEKTEYAQNLEEADRLNSFLNIQEQCKKNNIELIFVFSPNYHTFNTSFYERFKSLVQPENLIVVYDTLNLNYKKREYYFDSSHLLKNGAEMFTSELSDFLEKTNNY